jgi:hypothetical protein
MPQLENFECSGAYFYDHQSLGVLNSLEKLFSTLKKLTLDNCTMDESDINDITRILQKNKYIEICVLKKASIPYFGKPRNLNYDEAVALVHAANMPGNPLKLLDLSDNKINKQPFTDTLRNDLTIRY